MLQDERHLMLICAFRYCLGRRSYIVGHCDGWIREEMSSLGEGDTELLIREIKEYLGREDKYSLSYDNKIWESLLVDLQNHLDSCVSNLAK